MDANVNRGETFGAEQDSALRRLFLNQLGVMHHAESLLANALLLVAAAAHDADLREVVTTHRKETVGHVETLEEIAQQLGVELPKGNSAGMKGLLKESVWAMAREAMSPAMDQALLMQALRIEHYEIASYGSLCAWAKQLGLEHALMMLKSVLDQEMLADRVLHELRNKEHQPLAEVVKRVSLGQAKGEVKRE